MKPEPAVCLLATAARGGSFMGLHSLLLILLQLHVRGWKLQVLNAVNHIYFTRNDEVVVYE